MDRQQAEQLLNSYVKIVTSNNFHFSGKVINNSDSTLTLIDKFGERVTLSFSCIMVCSQGFKYEI